MRIITFHTRNSIYVYAADNDHIGHLVCVTGTLAGARVHAFASDVVDVQPGDQITVHTLNESGDWVTNVRTSVVTLRIDHPEPVTAHSDGLYTRENSR